MFYFTIDSLRSGHLCSLMRVCPSTYLFIAGVLSSCPGYTEEGGCIFTVDNQLSHRLQSASMETEFIVGLDIRAHVADVVPLVCSLTFNEIHFVALRGSLH